MARLLLTPKSKKLHLFLLCFFLTIHSHPSNSHPIHQSTRLASNNIITTSPQPSQNFQNSCSDLHNYQGNEAKCMFVRSETSCRSEGYIDYLQLMYCACGGHPVFGYSILGLWLVLLFYLLGNTAAYYFCSSLQSLSLILKLSPTIAGVTLLALGNGAPDVFSSIVSFMGPEADGVGFNSILGGAFVVSSCVVGVVSISVRNLKMYVDKSSFVRDVCFFLLALGLLLLMLIVGRINLWGAIAFASLYFVYVFVVSTAHFCTKKDRLVVSPIAIDPLLPISKILSPCNPAEFGELGEPLLDRIGKEEQKPASVMTEAVENDDQRSKTSCFCFNPSASFFLGRILYILEMPLYLPRRLTIPVVCEEKWSKPFAVISVTLAPFLLAALWNSQERDLGFKANLIIYICGGLIGIFLGITAFMTTEQSSPPRRFLFPWLAGGFLMSVVWTYITAQELVALLISLGNIIGISPSVLGLTVLAWGNSIGDLIANVAMALHGGPGGAQIAISGCYAGPIFNILMGLGLPLVFSSWQVYPSSYVVPKDPSLYQTLGFSVGGLLWALVILPRQNMRPDRILGLGLLAIYLCFLSVRLAYTLGLVQFHGPMHD